MLKYHKKCSLVYNILMHYCYFWTGTHTHAAIQSEVTLQPWGCHCATQPSVCACHMSWEWETYVYKGQKLTWRMALQRCFIVYILLLRNSPKFIINVVLGCLISAHSHFPLSTLIDIFELQRRNKRCFIRLVCAFEYVHSGPYTRPLIILLWH